jgi:hypothetical protein
MASRRRIRRNMCDRKHRHATLSEARAHVIAHRRRFGARLFPYRCAFCKFWHVGHRESKGDAA